MDTCHLILTKKILRNGNGKREIFESHYYLLSSLIPSFILRRNGVTRVMALERAWSTVREMSVKSGSRFNLFAVLSSGWNIIIFVMLLGFGIELTVV